MSVSLLIGSLPYWNYTNIGISPVLDEISFWNFLETFLVCWYTHFICCLELQSSETSWTMCGYFLVLLLFNSWSCHWRRWESSCLLLMKLHLMMQKTGIWDNIFCIEIGKFMIYQIINQACRAFNLWKWQPRWCYGGMGKMLRCDTMIFPHS